MFQLKRLQIQYPDMLIAVEPFELMPAHDLSEVLYVQAQSGFGKTTLLRAIAGLEPCDGEFTGSDLPVHQRQIGFVFQEQLLLAHLNATENVMLGMEFQKIPKDEARARAEKGLNELGLETRLNAPITTLSGGERQRIALLRALLTRPKLLLLDEPFKGLDIESQKTMRLYLGRYLADHAVPVIWVSHETETGKKLVGVKPAFKENSNRGEAQYDRKFIIETELTRSKS
jgi:molybdate transport system ATP-binding protein